MNISGIGLVFTRGRGIGCLERSIGSGNWVAPVRKAIPKPVNEGFMPVYNVSKETMTDSKILGTLRRADRITRMAVLAAYDALEDSRASVGDNKESFGIIMATTFGAHNTVFRYLDEMIEFGEKDVSPMVFSHIVHNAVVSYVATVLDNRGPAITMSQFAFSFQEALNIARVWLNEGRCGRVLVGASDECGDVMEAIWRKKWKMAEDGRIKPFDFSAEPKVVLGEGSIFFMLTNDDIPKRYCEISDIQIGEGDTGRPDMYVLDADGIFGDETRYKELADTGVMVAGYAPVFGSMFTGSAFSCAVAALMLKNQTRYAVPVSDNPYKANICWKTEQADLNEIHCVRFNEVQRRGLIKLRK